MWLHVRLFIKSWHAVSYNLVYKKLICIVCRTHFIGLFFFSLSFIFKCKIRKVYILSEKMIPLYDLSWVRCVNSLTGNFNKGYYYICIQCNAYDSMNQINTWSFSCADFRSWRHCHLIVEQSFCFKQSLWILTQYTLFVH